MTLGSCGIRRSSRLRGVEIVAPRRSYGLVFTASLSRSRQIVGAPGEAMEAVENIPQTPCFPQAPTATATAGFLTALTSEGLTTATESDLNRVSAKSREAHGGK